MGRIIGIAAALVVLLAGAAAIYAYGVINDLEVSEVTEDVSVIHGLGGNVGVLRTEDGVVIVDTMTFVSQGRQIRQVAERIGGGPTQAIINTMSIHGQTVTDPDGTVREAGEHAEDLESILSPGSSWRSARPTPLPLPGFNFVIEACSPKYAKMAMSTGLHHVTALPCEITVQVIDQDPTVTGKETLVVSYLDPHFMLGALFADISEAEQQAFEDENIPGEIMDDLQDIVAAALEGYDLSTGVPITYDMLP